MRRGLAPFMEGALITQAQARRPDLRFPLPARFTERLSGVHIDELRRRGKYLVAQLTSGETLIMHLGMSGRFTIDAEARGQPGIFHHAPAANPRHDHIVFHLEGAHGAARVIFNDPRRFGFMDLTPTKMLETCAHFAGMGPEPLSTNFTVAVLNEALKGRTAPIKSALLDQRLVAGVGNIYACEALFRAGISPRRRAASVPGVRAGRLHTAITDVLNQAIEAGGSSLRDFAGSDGALGYFQHRFEVYDRDGRACVVCAAPIRRIVQAGRSTFYCSRCQR